MKVSKELSLELLSALGFQGVGNYPDKKILEKLSTLHTTKGGPAAIEKLADENLKNFGTDILEARKKNTVLELEDDLVYDLTGGEDDETTEEVVPTKEKTVAKKEAAKPAPKASAKPVAKPAEKTEPKAPKKDPAGSDQFGSRLGTRAARINAVVTKEFKSSAQIKEDAKYDKDPNSHLRWMITNGWAEFHKGHGYRLTNKALQALGQKGDQKPPPAPVAKEKPAPKEKAKAVDQPAPKQSPKAPPTPPKKPVAPAPKAPAKPVAKPAPKPAAKAPVKK